MKDERIPSIEKRLLVLGPASGEAGRYCEVLIAAGMFCLPCADLQELCDCLETGAAGAIITEEVLASEEAPRLLRWLRNQPPWSDFPFLLLTGTGTDSPAACRAMELLGNVVLIPRPPATTTLISIARAGLRLRRRQYQARRQMAMLDRAREEAEEANRVKSEFLANISHEIRTPMTVFLGAIDHLLEISEDPEHRQLLALADKSVKRLHTLIDNILDFTQLEAKHVEPEEMPFDLRACVDQVMAGVTASAAGKSLRLSTEIDPEVPGIVIGDSARVGQVLSNLVDNAIKFTHKGEIRVSVRPRGQLVEFTVADTGLGIPEEKRNLIFRKFSQVNGSFTRSYGGIGLGLALSKMLVELMGGEITFESDPAKGSIFSFVLPLKSTARKDAESPTAPSAAKERNSTGRILVAEDEPLVREVLTMMLTAQGWQTDTARTGLDAVRKWEDLGFDVVFMDLQMPEMNGIEATREIRRKEAVKGRRTCIIGLTAHTLREIRKECLRVGMDRVLTKPVQMKELNDAICGCLAMQGRSS